MIDDCLVDEVDDDDDIEDDLVVLLSASGLDYIPQGSPFPSPPVHMKIRCASVDMKRRWHCREARQGVTHAGEMLGDKIHGKEVGQNHNRTRA